jgi:hypothetical protein
MCEESGRGGCLLYLEGLATQSHTEPAVGSHSAIWNHGFTGAAGVSGLYNPDEDGSKAGCLCVAFISPCT